MSRSLHNLVFFVVSFMLFRLYFKNLFFAFLFVLMYFLFWLKTADCIQVYCFLPPRFFLSFQWQHFDGDRLFTTSSKNCWKKEDKIKWNKKTFWARVEDLYFELISFQCKFVLNCSLKYHQPDFYSCWSVSRDLTWW